MASAARRAMLRLPFAESTTPLQASTYLLGISLFSISFLVFLNSSVSFVITDLIGVKEGVGDIVGTLGFADELVALVACPAWGLASDRLGVRQVAVAGYAIIAVSLLLFVQATNVYPQLLLARILFAVGATAAATMVTAILPPLTDESNGLNADDEDSAKAAHIPRNSVALSVESQLTITPERFIAQNRSARSTDPESAAVNNDHNGGDAEDAAAKKPSVLAGLVGLFTGCGALVALFLFLPLPVRFGQAEGTTPAQAVSYAFYVVAAVAALVAIFVSVGLRGIKGENGKGWRSLLGLQDVSSSSHENGCGSRGQSRPSSRDRYLPYGQLLRDSIRLGVTDPQIGLGYLGGFVARASTVAISLFVPLFVNTFFIRNGFCQGSPHDPSPELKKECRAAYVLASALSGVAQLMGLLCAPLFGYLSSRNIAKASSRKAGMRHLLATGLNYPVILATLFGVVGYIAFPMLPSPEIKNVDGRGGSPIVFLVAALLGVSQIGSIVCSLGSLGRGVLTADLPAQAGPASLGAGVAGAVASSEDTNAHAAFENDAETEPLLRRRDGARHATSPATTSRVRLKGSIAGVYSWCGGAAILLLTKLGGYLFDSWSNGAPFYMMAAFNAVLLIATVAIDVSRLGKAAR